MPLHLTVLNPAIRFEWIQNEWDEDYIFQAKEIILQRVSTIIRVTLCTISKRWVLQMHQYHSQTSLTTVPEAPVRPSPVARGKTCPTRFRVEDSAFEKKKSSSQVLGVDAEFRKYTLSDVSSDDTDILWFWEVRCFSSNGTMTHLLNRPIRKSFPLCSPLLWTTSQSRQHPCLANAYFRQRRRPTLPNETG